MNGLSLSQALGGLRIANPDGDDDSADEAVHDQTSTTNQQPASLALTAADTAQGQSQSDHNNREDNGRAVPSSDAVDQPPSSLDGGGGGSGGTTATTTTTAPPPRQDIASPAKDNNAPDPTTISSTAARADTGNHFSRSASQLQLDSQHQRMEAHHHHNPTPQSLPFHQQPPYPDASRAPLPPQADGVAPQLRRAHSARLGASPSIFSPENGGGGWSATAAAFVDPASPYIGISRTDSRTGAGYPGRAVSRENLIMMNRQQMPMVPPGNSPIPPRRTSRGMPGAGGGSAYPSPIPGNAYDPLPQSSTEWQERGAAVGTRKEVDASGRTVVRTVRKGVRDFAFGQTLGEGSYSTVYAATDRQTLKEYAIKVLEKKHIIKEKKIKYVNIEKNTLNKLTEHPGIVRLYYTFQDELSLYYVLDMCDGGELLGVLKKTGTFDEECTRFYGAQILDAIEYMHSCHIIHRDLKPENLLLDSNMHIKITDFGTAKILQDPASTTTTATTSQSEDPSSTEASQPLRSEPEEERASSFVGTAEYVSPELLKDKNACKASDLWAFGCIIYQLLAGRPPFKAATEYLTFEKIVNLDYRFPDGFPPHARDLVERCLVRDPAQRITIEHIKSHAFFAGQPFGKILWRTKAPHLRPYIPRHEPPRGNNTSNNASNNNNNSARPSRIITELPPPTQLDIEWSPVLTRTNERILKLGALMVISNPIPSSPRGKGSDHGEGHKKLSRFFGGNTTKKRERLVMVTSGGRILLAPAGGEDKRTKHDISLLAPDSKWRTQTDAKGQLVWSVDSAGVHYIFEEPKSSASASSTPPTPSADEWIESLERARELAISQNLLGGPDSGFADLPSAVSSPASTLGGRSGYPEGYGVSGRAPKNQQSEETKRNRFSKRQSKNGLGSAF